MGLPADAGETFAQSMEREPELPRFARFHFRGHWDADGTEMTGAICKAAGQPSLPIKPFPWWALTLGGPFNETMREVSRTRPLWQNSISLNNARLESLLGREPHTPLATAVETTLRGMGCVS